jgi:hypothetical protein
MVRRLLSVLACSIVLVGCSTHSARVARTPPPAAGGPFPSEEAKMLACLDLQDHIVDLYTGEFVSNEGLSMTPAQRSAFRDGWAEELAKRGTFDRWEQVCFYGLTPSRYRCGMESQSPTDLVACMKLG